MASVDDELYRVVREWLDANPNVRASAAHIAKQLKRPVGVVREALWRGVRTKEIGQVYHDGLWRYCRKESCTSL